MNHEARGILFCYSKYFIQADFCEPKKKQIRALLKQMNKKKKKTTLIRNELLF